MSELLDLLVTEIRKEQGLGLHTKAPSNYNTSTLLTQPGGIFTVAGMERNVVSTHISPMGIGSYLPAFPSNTDDPRYGFILGFTNETGAEATNPCDDAPTGFMKGGNLTGRFGRVMRQTNTIEIDKLLHESRSSSMDLQLMGSMLGGVGPGNMMANQDPTKLVLTAEMVGVGVNLERKLSTMAWQGTPTNNTSGGGYMEFPGLDSQIATGHMDADTGTLMPAADSMILDFGYTAVDGTAKDIVQYVSHMEYKLRNISSRTGMDPTTWAITMRPELWMELSAVWPCRYLTNRCTTDGNTNPMVLNDSINVDIRDRMRNTSTIMINGRTYPVIEDDGIFEHTNINNANVPAGSYASSISFIPLRTRGNFPTTYWQYIDYRKVNAQLSPMGMGQKQVPFWTENGLLLWVYRDNGYCFDMQAKVEPRIILRTPHLAGKIQGVLYSPLSHLRSPDPDSPYWVNGGLSVRGGSDNYAVWGNWNS